MHAMNDARAPWLSVLVPAHKAEAHIEACLHSVLAQADDGVELLVLDDASDDGTWAAIQRVVQAHAGRLRALRAEANRGVSAARNALLANADGGHVWFVDADDIVEAGAIAQLRELLQAQPVDLVLCDFRYLNGSRPSPPRCTFAGRAGGIQDDRSALIAGLLEAGELHVWSKIARREVWLRAPFPEARYFEDIAVTLPLIHATRSFIHVHRPWIGYRRHPTSIMATITPAKVRQWLASVEELRQGLLDDVATPAARRALDYFSLRNFASLLRHARSLQAQDPALQDELAASHARLFPQGAAAILREWRRRGWWLRAWRVRRRLSEAGLA